VADPARVARRVEAPLLSASELGEPRWLPAAAVLTAAGLYVTLPSRFIAGSSTSAFSVVRWLVPAVSLALLAPLALSAPRRRVVHSVARRTAAVALIAFITVANGAAIIFLIHLLLTGAKAHARELLRAAIHMWCMNVIVFGLWFWQLDGGGPAQRRTGVVVRDFLFPQQELGENGGTWQPKFFDYLYVSFTNATAFSPTDTMPLSAWAKLLMMVQSAVSLLLAVMVVARAINILG
jgi:uncharacterized membrane protein